MEIVPGSFIGMSGPAIAHPSCVRRFTRGEPETEDSEVELRLSSWLAEEEGLSHLLRGKKLAETEKAILLRVGGREEWIPKSQIEEYISSGI